MPSLASSTSNSRVKGKGISDHLRHQSSINASRPAPPVASSSSSQIPTGDRDNLPLQPPDHHRYGICGKPVTLRVNCFAVSITNRIIYDYDIVCLTSLSLRSQRAAVVRLLREHPPFAPYSRHVAHDGSHRLVSAKRLPQPCSLQISVQDGSTAGNTVTINIHFVKELNINELEQYMEGLPERRYYDPQPCLSALNLIMHQFASESGIRTGKNRYCFPPSTESLTPGLEFRKGFHVSVRPTYRQLMVKVDVRMAAFHPSGNLADIMQVLRSRPECAPIERSLRLVMVKLTHLGHTTRKRITRFMDQTARQLRIHPSDVDEIVSVEEYYRQKYGIVLQYADTMPLVQLGTSQRASYVPAELCQILPDQPFRGHLPEVRDLDRWALEPPSRIARIICEEGTPSLGFHPHALATPLSAFGVTIDTQMAVVSGRVLPSPTIIYKDVQPLTVIDGSWSLANAKAYAGAELSNWAVLLVQDGGRQQFQGVNDPELAGFLNTFVQQCRAVGMSLPDKPLLMATPALAKKSADHSRVTAMEQIKQTIVENLRERPSVLVVLLSDDDDRTLYCALKYFCDVVLGIHAVHILSSKIRGNLFRRQKMYLSSVASRINSKLGGINYELDLSSMRCLTEAKTMIVGVYLWHPSPSSLCGTPSIAVLVANIDDRFHQFPAHFASQTSAIDSVQDIGGLMTQCLQLYQSRNGGPPDRVLVYHAGVLDSAAPAIVVEEVTQIAASLQHVRGKNRAASRPKVTIVQCTRSRRPHIFVDPTAPDDGGYVPSGTVVDRGIGDVFEVDFFLQTGQKGTRPSRYTVKYDENDFSADVLQQITHTLVHLGSANALSLPAPVHYATLAAKRASNLVEFLVRRESQNLTDGQDLIDGKSIQAQWRGIHCDLKETMFYV